jgi:hypothetical protein
MSDAEQFWTMIIALSAMTNAILALCLLGALIDYFRQKRKAKDAQAVAKEGGDA